MIKPNNFNFFAKLSEKLDSNIALYNTKISKGEKLSAEEAEDLSFSIKAFPYSQEFKKLVEDLEYAQNNKEIFDKDFIFNIETRLEELSTILNTIQKEKNSEDISEFIIEMRAGAGGEESSLFVQNLFDAYTRFLTGKKLPFELLETSETEAGGYSTLIAEIRSKEAYRLLKYEGGVHRVQRVPKTESSGRIHTSTISVAILPISKKSKVEIKPNDLKIDVYRSSGNGGQSVNTTDSAVRITHTPSGIVVTSQNTKSQIKNKEMAMKVLEARLQEAQNKSQHEGQQEIRNKQILNSDRSEKIRTYNYLQDRITDHRVKLDFSNITRFMQGEIQDVLEQIGKKLDDQAEDERILAEE